MSQVHRELADKIVSRLVEAGLPTFASHQFGMVDRDRVLKLILEIILPYTFKAPKPQWMKDAEKRRRGGEDAFTK